MDTEEVLWRMYDDNRIYARHHEDQRATASNITMVISAGIIGLLTFDQELSVADLPLTAFLALIGIFGAAFSAKHYERVRLHLYRAEQYIGRLEKLCPDAQIEALRTAGTQKAKERFPWLFGFQLNKFWILLHLFTSLVGIVMTALIVFMWAR